MWHMVRGSYFGRLFHYCALQDTPVVQELHSMHRGTYEGSILSGGECLAIATIIANTYIDSPGTMRSSCGGRFILSGQLMATARMLKSGLVVCSWETSKHARSEAKEVRNGFQRWLMREGFCIGRGFVLVVH
jgi:hypothetical protein